MQHRSRASHPSTLHVGGVFQRLPDAQRALESLAEAGFGEDEVSLICPKCEPGDGLGLEPPHRPSEHAAKGALEGGGVGALVGALVALVGATTTGGVSLLVAGPLLAGAGGGAIAGGFFGAMVGRGIDEDSADFYDQSLERGSILVAVDVRSDDPRRVDAAARLLRAAGGDVRTTRN